MSVAKAVLCLTLRKILLTTDYSPASRTALPFAAALARHYGATLHIAHIMEPEPFPSVPMDAMPVDIETEREDDEQKMNEFVHELESYELTPEIVFDKGEVAPVVSRIIKDSNIDLVVLGTHGRGGLARILLGSVAEQIYRHATCPVLTVGPHATSSHLLEGHLETIMFTTDFAAGSAQALEYAVALTAEHGAQLVMLHVAKPASIPLDYTELLVAQADRKLKTLIPPETHFAKPPMYSTPIGAPAEEILKAAKLYKADLIVMGAHHAPDVATHWPIEVAHSVMSAAECPVLSVRS